MSLTKRLHEIRTPAGTERRLFGCGDGALTLTESPEGGRWIVATGQPPNARYPTPPRAAAKHRQAGPDRQSGGPGRRLSHERGPTAGLTLWSHRRASAPRPER